MNCSMRSAIALLIAPLAIAACTAARSEATSTNATSEALAEAWLDAVTAKQAEALDDLAITRTEYVASLEATAECLVGRGYGTGPIVEVPGGIRMAFQIHPGSNRDDPSDFWNQCAASNLDAVESVYFAQHARPESELRQVQAELVTCLENHGIDGAAPEISDWNLFHLLELHNAGREAWGCRERFLILTGQVGARPPGWHENPS